MDIYSLSAVWWILIIFSYFLIAIVWGIACNAVGKTKGIKGFWWGFFLGVFGLVVVGCMQNKEANRFNKYEQLEKLLNLKNNGIITEQEFEKEKSIIMQYESENANIKENTREYGWELKDEGENNVETNEIEEADKAVTLWQKLGPVIVIGSILIMVVWFLCAIVTS